MPKEKTVFDSGLRSHPTEFKPIDRYRLNNDDSLFTIDSIHMMTKLRPFVRTFLEEASNLFECSYTPWVNVLTLWRWQSCSTLLINTSSRDDSTHNHRKALDILMGHESAVLILDDTEAVTAFNLIKFSLFINFQYNSFFRCGKRIKII